MKRRLAPRKGGRPPKTGLDARQNVLAFEPESCPPYRLNICSCSRGGMGYRPVCHLVFTEKRSLRIEASLNLHSNLSIHLFPQSERPVHETPRNSGRWVWAEERAHLCKWFSCSLRWRSFPSYGGETSGSAVSTFTSTKPRKLDFGQRWSLHRKSKPSNDRVSSTLTDWCEV
jgi:hypothetical protein